MDSKRKIENNLFKQNGAQKRISKNIRNESDYSYGKDPDMLQQYKDKKTDRQKDESAYSFGRDPDEGNGEDPRIYHNRNLWTQDTHYKFETRDFQREWRDDITSSEKTNHTYVYVNETQKPPEAKPRKQSNRCRIVQIIVVVLVLALLGVIAFFIVRSFTSKGEENECASDEQKDSSGSCKLLGCRDIPEVENGYFNVTDNMINSTANLQCSRGFMANASIMFHCLPNGSWVSNSEAACFIHPCGPYTLSDHVVVREDLSHINMTITLRCEEGFDFTNKSDTFIQCVDTTWKGSPGCEIPGILTTESTQSSVNIGDSFDISCRLRESPRWQTIMISRSDISNGSIPKPLFSITSDHTSGMRYDATTFREKVTTFEDGVLLQLTFDTSSCEDTGIYTCAVIVGDIKNPKGIKTSSKDLKLIETASRMKVIVAPTSHVQGDVVNVLCKGLIGQDENGSKLGKIIVKLYWDEDTSKDIISDIESTTSAGCQVDEIVNATFVITNDMHGAELQCIARGDDGRLDKKSILLNVTTTIIQISASAPTVLIGESLTISTLLTNIRGWSTIELRKNCINKEIAIFSIQENDTISNLTTEQHIVLMKSDINKTTASFAFQFPNITCGDACWKGGQVEYIIAVNIRDSWMSKSESIEFKKNPSVPVLELGQDKFYKGQEASLKCVGNIGIPLHYMSITEDESTLLKRPSSSKVKLNNETCENVETITHTFEEVKDDLEGRKYQCVTKLMNETSLSSNVEIINITAPILYFTDDSLRGNKGNTKQIHCILTETTNLSYVEISRYSTEDVLCEVNASGEGKCKDGEKFSISGAMSEDETVFNTTLTIHKTLCSNEALYSCKAVGVNVLKTSMKFKVQAPPTIPILRLPTTIVKDQQSNWDDQLTCTAYLGYPINNRRLKIEYKNQSSNSYTDHVKNKTEFGDCDEKSSIKIRQHMFPISMNSSTVRCVIVDENNNVIESSSEQHLRILENICEETRAYGLHPYNCSRYIRCISGRLYDMQCAPGACALEDCNCQNICNGDSCLHC